MLGVQVSLTKDMQGAAEVSVVWSSFGTDLTQFKPYFSTPKVVEFPTKDGKVAYANVYSPTNRDFVAPAAERPPLLVKSHGMLFFHFATAATSLPSCWFICFIIGRNSELHSIVGMQEGRPMRL